MRNIRDDATHDSAALGNLCQIHSATGAMVDELSIVDSDPYNIQDSLTEYEFLAACGAMLAAEGPNEPNNFNFNYDGQLCSVSTSFAPCARYQAALYRAVKSDPRLQGKPVWSLTEPGVEPDNQGLQFLTIPDSAATLQPPDTVYADFANLHNYVKGNGQTSIENNQAWYAEANAEPLGPFDGPAGEFLNYTWLRGFPASPYSAGPAMPKVTTETGWPTDGSITEDQQGKLFTNLYLSARKLNWSYTFIYMMFDEAGQGNYGLFAQNANSSSAETPKLSGTYIHNMTSILADTSSSFVPVALDYTIPDEPATVHDLLMQKSNGTYELAIWGDQVEGESSNVTVNLGRTFATVNVYDVTIVTTAIKTLRNVQTLPAHSDRSRGDPRVRREIASRPAVFGRRGIDFVVVATFLVVAVRRDYLRCTDQKSRPLPSSVGCGGVVVQYGAGPEMLSCARSASALLRSRHIGCCSRSRSDSASYGSSSRPVEPIPDRPAWRPLRANNRAVRA